MNQKVWDKIKSYRAKYKDSINGWAVAYMVGEEFISEKSKVSKSKRKKIGKSNTKTA